LPILRTIRTGSSCPAFAISALDLPPFLTQIVRPVERDIPKINHNG
jgi:hypothetical protein